MTAAAPIRVLIADDSAEIRGLMRRLLDRERDMEIVGELDTADKLLDVVASARPTVAVIDLGMPGRASLPAIAEAHEAHPTAKFIVYSGSDDRETLQGAMAVPGVVGFLSKEAELIEIVRTVREVAMGHTGVVVSRLASDRRLGWQPMAATP